MRGLTEFGEIRREIIFEYLDRFPDHGNHTVAGKIYNEHPELFATYDDCRGYIRYYRGNHGNKNRKYLKTKKYVRE